MQKRIKMAAFDLDRTLLREDKSVSAYTQAVLARWRASGHKLVLASARPMRTMQEYIALLDADGVAAGNGVVIWTPDFERELPMDHDASEAFLAAVLERFPNSTISAEIDETLYANFEIPEWQPTILSDMTRLPRGNVRKIILTYVDEAHLAQIRAMLLPGMNLSVSNRQIIQIHSVRAGKWSAVRELAARWGIDCAQIACFGDDWDDLEMIKKAGWGAAVDNAIDAVKAAADEIVPANEADGPARRIARWTEEAAAQNEEKTRKNGEKNEKNA